MSVREIARQYIAQGYAVIPVMPRGKKPKGAKWTDLRIAPDEIDANFSPTDNIGILTGKPSNNLWCVDVDSAQAKRLAEAFLPKTALIVGRTNEPGGHWFYRSPEHEELKSQVWQLPDMFAEQFGFANTVELLSTGRQVVVGPSIHPSGDTYDILDQEPATVSADTLLTACANLDAAVRLSLGIATAPVPEQKKRIDRPPVDNSSYSGDREIRLKRATAYTVQVPGAVSGQGGHKHTFTTALKVAAFGLSQSDVYDVMSDWNRKCEPPWSDAELLHKVEDACKANPDPMEDRSHERNGVDLRHIVKSTDSTPKPAESTAPPLPTMDESKVSRWVAGTNKRNQFDAFADIISLAGGGPTIEASGADMACFPASQEHGKKCVLWEVGDHVGSKVGIALYRHDGHQFEAHGTIPERLCHYLKGSQSGLIYLNGFAKTQSAKVIWITNTVTSGLALAKHLSSESPSHIPEDHVVVIHAQVRSSRPRLDVCQGKWVFAAPTSDEIGIAWADRIAKELAPSADNVRVIKLPYEVDPDHGRDARDYFNDGSTVVELMDLAQQAEPLQKPTQAEIETAAISTATTVNVRESFKKLLGNIAKKVDVGHDPHKMMAELKAEFDKISPPICTLRFRTAGELVASFPTLRPSVVEGLIRRGETMNVIAAPKTGKSWLSTGLGLSVVSGQKWLNRFCTRIGKVLMVDNELHEETSADRIPRVATAMGIEKWEWQDRLVVVNLRGELIDLVSLSVQLNAIKPDEYNLIILDAWYRFQPEGTDENANGDISRLYNLLDSVANKIGSAFVCIHHSSKGNQAAKGVTDVGAGAGAQSRAPDAHLVMRAHEEENAVVIDAAVRSFPPLERFCARWEFPTWKPADDLDPNALKSDKPRKEGEEPLPAGLTQDQNDRFKILRAHDDHPEGETKSILRDESGVRTTRFGPIFADFLRSGQIEVCNVVKNNKTHKATRLTLLGKSSLGQLGQLVRPTASDSDTDSVGRTPFRGASESECQSGFDFTNQSVQVSASDYY